MGYHSIIAAMRDPLDMGDLVIRESPPNMGGMDIYHKSPDGEEKVTFLNEMGMEALGDWINRAVKEAATDLAAGPLLCSPVALSANFAESS